jgi:hypothetical protein
MRSIASALAVGNTSARVFRFSGGTDSSIVCTNGDLRRSTRAL